MRLNTFAGLHGALSLACTRLIVYPLQKSGGENAILIINGIAWIREFHGIDKRKKINNDIYNFNNEIVHSHE